jgi:sialic acid synthase SpsE
MNTEIIAEIAQGYEGDPKLAELLVKGALVAGADAVKIQIIFADELCVPGYPYYGLFKSLEMDENVWQGLVSLVQKENKKIYFDVFGDRSLALAKSIGADGVKISTTDFYNISLVKKAFKAFDFVILSTGGIHIEDVDEVLNTCKLPHYLMLMHGFQAEPTDTPDNNLARINSLRSRYAQVGIGFMDHSLGCAPEAFHLPLVALGLGVDCIEKHITLDYSLEIEDYISALSVDRFKQFVTIIRSVESAMGSSVLSLTDKEIEYKNRASKVVVAKRDLVKGDVLTEQDLAMKRVSTKPSNLYFQKVLPVLGKPLLSSLKMNKPIEKGML